MRTYSTDILFLGDNDPIANAFITVDGSGQILKFGPLTENIEVDEHFVGGLCPGFVNAHCHLELSFMFQKIPTHIGLIEFIKNVIEIRDQFEQTVQQEAIQQAADEMFEKGIVAVGDISNDTRSFAIKKESPLRFHTFVEVFDFEANATVDNIYKGIDVYDAAPKTDGNSASITPHAPYSCTPTLINFCDRFSRRKTPLLSIHNQEQPQENQYFMDKTGPWDDLFRQWDINQDWFLPANKTSLQAMGELLSDSNQVIYVHNTFTSSADVEWATKHLKKAFFCSCPNANLYIENQLPNYSVLIDSGASICLGTDSLASNWQLSILEEMKTIQAHFPQYNTDKLIEWACYNGAQALFMEKELGSITVGKTPGIVHISNLDSTFNLTKESQARRVI